MRCDSCDVTCGLSWSHKRTVDDTWTHMVTHGSLLDMSSYLYSHFLEGFYPELFRLHQMR